MKKILILIIVLSSCLRQTDVRQGVTNTPKNNTINLNDLEIIVIDSCEYISYIVYSHAGILTHKGNCKNCRK